ncbi:hypothetical protein [uncultured Polaribacter sp.]|uniref:hypothetical protein n=1 Tax=uncultured Polaribacter sp. TaxID=174711 RepID=UPI00262ED85B|nr:hypothetical protein [uncultured Polaribacter sp.]
MNKTKAIQILNKVYHHTNTNYDDKETFYKYGLFPFKTDFLTDEQIQTLKKNNLIPNLIEQKNHNDFLSDLIAIRKHPKINIEFVTKLFLKGLSGESRFRQSLMSYWFIKDLKKHDYNQVTEYRDTNWCSCGLPDKKSYDITHQLYTYHIGHSWNEFPETFALELNEIINYPEPEILKSDKDRLIKLLKVIANAPENETPGKLEKRIGKEKILPKTDKYKRYGILQTLAVTEILPSNKKFDKQPFKSDIVMPLAGWKGELGVDFKKAEEIFKITIPNTL